MWYIKLHLLLHVVFDDAELVFPSNIFGNLLIFIELFSIAKSASLVLVSRGFMVSALHPHRWRPEDFRTPPSWRGVPRLAQGRRKESTENAGKCAVRSGSWGQIRLMRGC